MFAFAKISKSGNILGNLVTFIKHILSYRYVDYGKTFPKVF